jgi:hypothetical protein
LHKEKTVSAKISMMLGFMPQFQNFSKCEVDGQPSNEQEFLASVRLYKRNPEGGPSLLVAPAEWGFTYADVMAHEVAVKDYAMAELRKKRDELLAATDGVTMKCVSRGLPIPNEWKAYQEALRDLPANSNPDFDAGGNLVGISWPTEPATKP